MVECPKPRRISDKGLTRKLDKARLEELRANYDGTICPSCCIRVRHDDNAIPQMADQTCHIITRSRFSVRWHPLNSYLGCGACNILYENYQPFISDVLAWWQRKIGDEAFNALILESHRIPKFSKADKLQILSDIQKRSNRFEGIGPDEGRV